MGIFQLDTPYRVGVQFAAAAWASVKSIPS